MQGGRAKRFHHMKRDSNTSQPIFKVPVVYGSKTEREKCLFCFLLKLNNSTIKTGHQDYNVSHKSKQCRLLTHCSL